MTITTVLWDLDGTLVQSESIQDEAIVHATNQMGKTISLDDLPKDGGMDNKVLFKHLFDVRGSISENEEYKKWFKLAVDYVLTHLPKAVPVHQSVELVREFASRGISQSIVSNSHSKVISDCVDSLDIRQYMTHFIGRDCVTHGKPQPDLYLEGLWRSNATPEECLVFEDSATGIHAAMNAKIKNIVGIGLHEERLHMLAHNCNLSQKSWLNDILTQFF